MPGSDASQFTRMKKTIAIQQNSTRKDLKSTNRLTQYVTKLSTPAVTNKFLSSLRLKNTKPVTLQKINH
jgi:hypothetical protein